MAKFGAALSSANTRSVGISCLKDHHTDDIADAHVISLGGRRSANLVSLGLALSKTAVTSGITNAYMRDLKSRFATSAHPSSPARWSTAVSKGRKAKRSLPATHEIEKFGFAPCAVLARVLSSGL